MDLQESLNKDGMDDNALNKQKSGDKIYRVDVADILSNENKFAWFKTETSARKAFNIVLSSYPTVAMIRAFTKEHNTFDDELERMCYRRNWQLIENYGFISWREDRDKLNLILNALNDVADVDSAPAQKEKLSKLELTIKQTLIKIYTR